MLGLNYLQVREAWFLVTCMELRMEICAMLTAAFLPLQLGYSSILGLPLHEQYGITRNKSKLLPP